jgi:hypothetical protein
MGSDNINTKIAGTVNPTAPFKFEEKILTCTTSFVSPQTVGRDC